MNRLLRRPLMKRPRKTANLPSSIQRQLNMYALAASAAGVGLLALAPPSEAKIVYTPAQFNLRLGERHGVDLNHDGTPDFDLYWTVDEGVSVLIASGNGRPGSGYGVALDRADPNFALAIFRGAKIGPAREFSGYTFSPKMATASRSGSLWGGPWADGGKGVKNRYLGIKFQSKGEPHYGWARVTVTIENPDGYRFTRVLLTGYAYETIPDKPIIAGQTKGTDESSIEQPDAVLTSPIPDTPQPATLGALALGAPGLSIWRREDSVAAL
jgi:hypothetical protein